jgi:hypothetical protein
MNVFHVSAIDKKRRIIHAFDRLCSAPLLIPLTRSLGQVGLLNSFSLFSGYPYRCALLDSFITEIRIVCSSLVLHPSALNSLGGPAKSDG